MTNLKHLTLVSVLIAATCLSAQENHGTIVGSVRGPNGNPVAGATITLSGAQVLGSRNAQTDAQGRYRLPLILPGQYTVRVTMQGFIGSTATVTLTSGATISADLYLRSVAIQEEVVEIVGATNPIVDKTETKVASTYTANELNNLPTGGTTGVYAAMVLAPGVQGRDYARVRGGATGSAQYMMNGIVLRDPTAGQGRQYENNIDDLIQDAQVIQNPINAKYGFSSSGMVNVTTKTGSNDFEGSFRVKLANTAWRTYTDGPVANRWNELEQGINRDPNYVPYAYNISNPAIDTLGRQYELTLSGPIIKDRLTFSYGSRLIPKITSSSFRYNVLNANPANNNTYIPGFVTGDLPFTGPNPIVAGNPQAANWAGYRWGADPSAPTRTLPITATSDDTFGSYKLFWQITQNHQLEYNYTDNDYLGGVSINNYLGDLNNQQSSNRLTRSISYRGIIGESGILTATYGNRYNNIKFPYGPDDPVYVQLWNANQGSITGQDARSDRPVSGGSVYGNEIRDVETYTLDYNHILSNHNIDIGVQRIAENSSWTAGGINNRRFYSPGRLHDGTYMVFNVADPASPLWTGEGIQLLANQSLANRRAWLFNNNHVPTYIDYSAEGVDDIMFIGTTTSFYVNDNWTLNDHWAINLGVRVDNSKADDYTGERFNTTSISPRFRLQYDLLGNNQHIFAFSYTQSRGTLSRLNLGGTGHTSSGVLGFANSGSSVERRYFWNEGSAQPHWVDPREIVNTAKYGYYYYFIDHSQAWQVDPNLKPELTTNFELNYRRAFDQGGYFRVAFVYNYMSDGLYAELIDEVVNMVDPSGRPPENPAATYKRYLYNRSDRGRHYAAAETEWMMPLINQATYKLNWYGNWTVAKATGNAVWNASYSQASSEQSVVRFTDQLERIGIPLEYTDPWGEMNVGRHSVRTWLTYTHGVRGGIVNEVTLLAKYDSGIPNITSFSYNLPDNTFINSNLNGGIVTDFPTTTGSIIHPYGRGNRKAYDTYTLDLQWNVTVPIKDRLSFFVNFSVGNVFNTVVPTSYYTDWVVGTSRTWRYDPNASNWNVSMGDPLWGKMVAGRANGANWGVQNSLGLADGRRYFSEVIGNWTTGQFDVGFRF